VTIVDLLWALPLLLAIALALGTAGRREPADIARHVRRTFVTLVLGLASVVVVIRLIVSNLV
jgi:hypothetical protein